MTFTQGSIEANRRLNPHNETSSPALSLPAWTCEDVAAWLKTVELGHYVQIFLVHKIDGSKVVGVDNDKMKVSVVVATAQFCAVLRVVCIAKV